MLVFHGCSKISEAEDWAVRPVLRVRYFESLGQRPGALHAGLGGALQAGLGAGTEMERAR